MKKSVPPEASRPIPPEEFVDGCILQYYYVEVIHAAVQCLLWLLGFVVSCVTIFAYTEEEESSSPANDELEFVKMRYRSPAHNVYRDNQTFDHVNMAEFTTLEMPPSYDTTMRDNSLADTTAANLYYDSDRQSVRSKTSTRFYCQALVLFRQPPVCSGESIRPESGRSQYMYHGQNGQTLSFDSRNGLVNQKDLFGM
ncbi:uncharacterized protein [Haliotis asinina]|uniref:uncharacterized protein n=1 Tax=Haliotis asinina TaxID=109174 RepID=UPI003531CE5D